MLANKKTKEKDVIDMMLDQLDFHGMTKEELTGENGLLRQHTRRFSILELLKRKRHSEI